MLSTIRISQKHIVMCFLLLFGCCSVMGAKPLFDSLVAGKRFAEAPPITTANLLIDVTPSSTTPGTGVFSYKIRYRLASVTDNGANANIAFTLPSSLEIVSLPVVGGNVKNTWSNNNQVYVNLESPASMGLPAGTLGAGSAGILETQVKFKCGVNGAGGMPSAGTTVNLAQNPIFTVSSVSATAAAPSAVTVPTLAACLPPASTTPTGIHKGKSGTVTGRGEYMHWWIEHGATTTTPYYVQDMLPNDMYLFDGLYCCSNFLPGYTVEVYANNTWWNITNYGKISTWIQSVANGGQLKDQNNVNITGCTRVQVTMPNDFTYGGSISYASNVRGIRVTIPANSSASGFALYTYTLPSAAVGWRQNCITSNNPSWTNFCTDVYVTDKPGLGIDCAMGNYNGNTQLGGTALFQGEWGGYNYLINNYPNLYKDPLDIQGMTSIYHYTKSGGLTGIKVEVILPAGFDFIQTGAQPNYYVVEASSYLSSYNSPSALVPTLTKNSNWAGTGRVALTWDFPNLNFPANGPVFINNPLMTLNVFFSARYVGTAPLPNAGDFLIYNANVKANVPFIDQHSALLGQETWCSAYSYTIPTSGGSVNSSKFVKGAFDTEQSRYPIVGSTNLNGDGEYEMFIYNHGFQNLKQLDVADVLPHIGDLDMLSATARGSQWSMELVEGISVERFKIGTGLASATAQLPLGVLYSNSTAPCYLEGSLPAGYVNADPSVANHGVGSGATVPSGCTDFNGSTPAAGARAFTFRWLNSADPLKFGEYLKIKVKVKQLNGETDRTNQEVAWNSFAYSAIESDNDRLLSTEPIKVGLRMINPNSTASIGDFVWKDLNGNGRQDAGEPGISGIKVYLYDGGGNKVTESFTLNGDWVSVPIYKVTDSTGKYNFMGLYPGSTYYVRLEDTANFAQGGALGGLVLTTANAAGVADDIDSDATNGTLSGSPALARPQITATTGAAGTSTNTYDFGFVAPGTIGNYVWFDADADGEQDPTETGVSGVTMTLYNAAGTVIATQTTNSQGFYLFSNIFPGNYYVQASTLPANRVATAQNATGNNETDSDFGSDLKTTLFTLSSGENIGYIDLGLRTTPASPASICGMAWDDFNQDGTRQAGEGGIRNVTVQLLSSTGFVITSTLTDASGNYCFMNLTPGTTYRVGFVNPAPGITSFTVAGTNQQANPSTGITTLSYTPTAGQNITNVDGGFIGPFSIGNLVFRDNNRNALFDAGDNAYQGIKVYLLNSAGTTILDSTVTDENGRYLFPLLAVGTYMVEIVVPNNFYSSTDIASSATPNNVDNDDNGVGTAPNGTRRIRTNTITLQAGGGTSGNANWTETDHGVLIDGYLDPAVNPKAYYTVDLGLATCPNITTQPLSNAYLCVGSTQSLAVVVQGAAFTYQWQSSTNGTSWTNISGATNASYTVPTTSLGTTYYRVMITSSTGCNTIYSTTSTIEVQTVAINLGADITQCYNAMFVMNAPTLASGQSGVWSVVSGTANISDVYDRNAAITINNGQTATLRWTVNNGACSAFDDIVLTNSTNCTEPTCPADAINYNGDLEQEGTATNFNLTFQGTPARLINESNRPAGWKDLYGSTPANTTTFLGAFYLKKTGAAGNPHSGTHMVYLKGNGFCLGALETGSNLQCGKTYRFTAWAAAYTNGATQLPAPFQIEYSVGNSGIYQSVEGRHTLLAPASTSWNALNWQRYSVEFTLPTDGFSWANFYFTSLDDNTGIVFDDICITEVNNGTYAYAGQDQGGCSNVFTMAATPVTAGYTGTWSVVSGSATIANPTSATSNVTITSGNAATLRWTVTSGASCTSTDDVTIGFVTPPSVSVNNATICNGSSATLTASGCSGGNLTWSTGATSSSITISPTSTTSYSVTCSPSPSSNLLLNPSFESNLTSWGIWGGSVTATTTVADVQSGTKAARINGVSAGWAGFGQSVTVTPGQFYTLTFYGKINVTGISSDLEVKFFNASSTVISSHVIPIKSTVYQLYTQTFVVPANTVSVQIDFGTNGITWLDNFSLIRSVNACNNSATGTVTVNPSVSISTHPANITQCVGGTQSLSVTAANAATYQWQSSANNSTWSDISGQTSATYIPPSTTAGTTYYRVVVGSASCGSANSNSATVVINSCVGSVGNYVWTDINGDGINNEPANAGMNGVTVQLYTAANVLVATTTTANDGSGNPGYYNFAITTSGDYYVKFPTTFGSKIVSPFQTTTAGIDNNSDANPSTGNSPTFTINVMGSGIAKDNPTIDAAFKCNLTASVTSLNVINCTNATTILTATPANGVTYAWNNGVTTQTQTVSAGGTYTVTVTDVANGCVASANVTVTVTPMATVGNYVWTDTNGNGLNDEAATAGINNITVELWNSTTNTLVATTTTASNGGNPGYYQFCVTTSGSYYVKFPTVNGIGRGLTTQTTTAATDNNSDANATTGQSPVFSLDVNGTGAAKNNMTIDAGYKAACPTGNCVPITIVKTN